MPDDPALRAALLQSPKFRALSGPQKIAAWKTVDSEFADKELPEQAMLMARMVSPDPQQKQPDQGIWRTLMQGAESMLGFGPQTTPGDLMTMGAGAAAEGVLEHQLGKKAWAERQGHPVEAGLERAGHEIAAATPLVGPYVSGAMEDIGQGRPRQGITKLGVALAPAAVHALPLPEGSMARAAVEKPGYMARSLPAAVREGAAAARRTEPTISGGNQMNLKRTAARKALAFAGGTARGLRRAAGETPYEADRPVGTYPPHSLSAGVGEPLELTSPEGETPKPLPAEQTEFDLRTRKLLPPPEVSPPEDTTPKLLPAPEKTPTQPEAATAAAPEAAQPSATTKTVKLKDGTTVEVKHTEYKTAEEYDRERSVLNRHLNATPEIKAESSKLADEMFGVKSRRALEVPELRALWNRMTGGDWDPLHPDANKSLKDLRAERTQQAAAKLGAPTGATPQPPSLMQQLQESLKNVREKASDFMAEEEGAQPRRNPADPVSEVALRHLMQKPLGLKATGANDVARTLDVAKAIRNEVRKRGGSLSPKAEEDVRFERAVNAMMDDLDYALGSQPEARHWYSQKVAEMERDLEQIRPDFKSPTTRALFKYLLGITSNGVDPQTNFDAAIRGWDLYKQHGHFMSYDPGRVSELSNSGKVGLTFRANSYQTAMSRLDTLVQEKGEAGAVKWLKTKHPVSELKKYAADLPVGDNAPRYGSYIFGEKVGSFGANLNGHYTELTADKWWSRTWNRWMGTSIATGAEGKFKVDPKTGEPILQDDPRNEGERNLMRRAAAHVADKMGLSVAELQAVLWYAEQELYRAHGIPSGSADYSMASKSYLTRYPAASRALPAPSAAPPP